VCIYPSKGSALAHVHPHNTYQTNKDYQWYEAKALDRNSRVSSRTFGYYKYTTGLSFAKERIGPLAAIVTTVFYLLTLYLLVLPNTPENPFASICSESLIKTTHQHLLLLVGFDTLIYRKYYNTPLYLWVINLFYSMILMSILRIKLYLHGIQALNLTHGLQAIPMKNSFTKISMKTLVHRDCH
jgi:hypothetical protein